MAEMAKFLFDTVFDQEETPLNPAAPRTEKTYWSTDERNQARSEGFESGRQTGINEANATTAAQSAAALDSIATNINTLVSELETQREHIRSEGIVLANMIARSLASNLIQREPLHEIEALFSEALGFLPDTPHIVVRLNEELLEDAKDKLEIVATERGFQGKLILLAQSDISAGDCRIEWAQGGIVKDQNLVAKRIQEITAQHIESSLLPDDGDLNSLDSTPSIQHEELKNDG